MAESPSSKMSAIPMRTIAHTKLTIRDFFKSASPLNQSMIVEEAKELIDELNVDMAAERIPANSNPFTPMGKCSIIKVGEQAIYNIKHFFSEEYENVDFVVGK